MKENEKIENVQIDMEIDNETPNKQTTQTQEQLFFLPGTFGDLVQCILKSDFDTVAATPENVISTASNVVPVQKNQVLSEPNQVDLTVEEYQRSKDHVHMSQSKFFKQLQSGEFQLEKRRTKKQN